MAFKKFTSVAAYDAAKSTLSAADSVSIQDNTLTAAQVVALAADSLIDSIRVSPLKLTIAQFNKVSSKLSVQDVITVADTSANLQKDLAALLADSKIDQIDSTQNASPLKLTAAQAADVKAMAKLQVTDKVQVIDTADNITSNLAEIMKSGLKVDSIDSSDNMSAITLTVAQATNDGLSAKLQATDTIQAVGTTADIQSKLYALLANTKIDAIDSTDDALLLYVPDVLKASNVAKLQIADSITVTGASSAIQTNLSVLLGSTKIDNIDSFEDSVAINISASDALNPANMAKLQAGDTINVMLTSADSSLTADQLAALRADTKIDNVINSFSVSSASLVAEGDSIVFTVTSAVPVAVDTVFNYQIQGNGANPVSAADVTPTSGTVTILAGQTTASVTIITIDDGIREFNEGAVFKLNDATGANVVVSQPFEIKDGASYVITPTASSINEGSIATFMVDAVNVDDNKAVPYTLSGSGITADDVVGGLTGMTTVVGGKATINVELAKDLKTEGVETLTVTLGGKSANVFVNDLSTDATFALTANQATANEGTDAKFTLISNAPEGSVVSYTIGGVTADDITGGLLTGSATLVGGSATITVPLAADVLTEGDETLSVTAGGQTAATVVKDTSQSPVLPVLGTDYVTGTIVSGQGTAIMNAATIASWLGNDTDPAGAPLTGAVSIDMTSAQNGQLFLLNTGDTIFVGNPGVRQGSFEYSVSGVDGIKGTINVTLNNAPVVTSGLTLSATEDATVTGTLVATDVNNDVLTYTFDATTAHGTVTAGANGSYTYTPNANYNGSDIIKATVTDGYATVSQDIAVTVAAVNDAPQVLVPAPATIAAKSGQTGITVDLSSYATDPDGDAVTFALASATTAHGGSVSLGVDGKTATVNYPQNGGAGALGDDTFNFTVTDGAITTPIAASVKLNVTNTAPMATDFTVSAKTGITQVVDFTGKAIDAENNALTTNVVIGSVSSGGSAEVPTTGPNAGKLVYTSTIGFTGVETMRYSVSDGFGGVSEEKIITFNVVSNTGGTSGDDLLFGTSKAEFIDGLAGNDTINGGGGLDTISGGDGSDRITFNDSAVQIQGGVGTGVDTLEVNSDAVASRFDLGLSLLTGNQNVDPNSKNSSGANVVLTGFENLDATKASNAITLVSDSANTTSIITGVGNDNLTLSKSTGSVAVNTGDGNDMVVVTGTGVYAIDLGAGNDSVTGSASSDSLFGGSGDDSLQFDPVNLSPTDTISGGEGNDKLVGINNTATGNVISDVGFTKVSSVETLTTDGVKALTATLDTFAKAAGLTTVSLAGGLADTVTVKAGFTAPLTINLDADTTVNTIDATAYTNVLTVNSVLSSLDNVANVITGGSASDVLSISVDADTTANLNGVSKIETVKLVDGVSTASNKAGITLANGNAGFTSTLIYDTITVDASALVGVNGIAADIAIVNASAETDAKVVVKGGAGNDTITGSSSANFGDDLSGGLGDDSFNFTSSSLKATDSVSGSDGIDKLVMTDAAANTVTDALFTKVTFVETLTADGNKALTATLDAAAKASGLTTVSLVGAATADVITVGAGFNGSLTVNLDSDDVVADKVDASLYTNALTVTTSISNMNNGAAAHTIIGGTGSDTLSMAVDTDATAQVSLSKVETVKLTDGKVDTTNTATLTLVDSITDAGKTLTLDASALVDSVVNGVTVPADKVVINASAETDGKIVAIGGSAADTITGSSSSLGDSINAGAGDDVIRFADARLTLLDAVDGGTGTNTLAYTDAATLANAIDADFTLVKNVQVLDISAAGGTVTLGKLASAAGISKVNGGASADIINLAAAAIAADNFGSDLTVTNFGIGADSVSGSATTAYSKNLTVSGNAVDLGGNETVVGGTGSDTLLVNVTSSNIAITSNISNVETIKLVDVANRATSFNTGVTLADGNAIFTAVNGQTPASWQTITVDASALVATTGVIADNTTINASAETNAKVVIKGGEGADTVTVSSSTNTDPVIAVQLGDNISTGLGADTIVISTTANLTAADSIDGGSGVDATTTKAFVDTINFAQGTANAVTDAMFTNVSNVEKILLSGNFAHSVILGTNAVKAGIVNVDVSAATSTSAQVDLSGMVGSAGVTITAGAAANLILGSNGNDTINGGGGADTINGGAGADSITLGTGSETVRFNLAAVTSGTTLTNADQISAFTTGIGGDKIDFSGITLNSPDGTLVPLTIFGSADGLTGARYVEGTAASMSNLAGNIVNAGLIFEVSNDAVVGKVGSPLVDDTLLNQTGINEAVTFITTNIGTSTAANTNVLLVVNDGANSAIFQYQEGALDQGIQASELTLLGVLVGNNGTTGLASGDFV